MPNKTLISLAVASSIALTGCLDDGSTGKNANPEYKIEDTTIDKSLVRPEFNPIITSDTLSLPTNHDLLLLLGASASPNYDFTAYTTGDNAAVDAINDLAGFSTSGQIDIPFDGSLNPQSIKANQTVFVVPLNMLPVSSSLDKIELTGNPSYIDTSNPFDMAALGALKYRAKAISLDGGTNNTIRITPLEPFPDQTKFLVVISDRVKGADGQSTAQSDSYQGLVNGGALGTDAFAGIESVVNAGHNLAKGWLGGADPEAKVTLAYTFTTSNTKTVLNTLTSPATYLTKLGQQVVFYSALEVVANNMPADATAQEKFTALGDALSDTPQNPELALKVLEAVGPYLMDPTLGQTVVGSAVPTMPFPQPRNAKFYKSTPAESLLAIQGSGNTTLQDAATLVTVAEGAIELPYYLELPGEDGSGIVDGMWRGSTAVETTLNTTIDAMKGTYASLSNFTFPRDADGTLNVTQYMPFPEENGKVVVPVTVFYPDVASCTSISDVVIFQHGITTDRSTAILPAINLAANGLAASKCIATVAIDQPLHGLSGATAGTIPGLTPLSLITDLVPTDFSADAVIGERHFNFTAKPNTLVPEKKDDLTEVSSGSLFVNLQGLQATRDNLRQGVMDLLNLSATMKSGAFDIDGAGALPANALAGANFHFVGHSLGGMTGATFAALSNDAVLSGSYPAAGVPGPFYTALDSVALMNTGGQLTKLVENSPALSGRVLAGLGAEGATQGTSTLESFFYAFQSTIDTVDPVNYAKQLGGNTPRTLISEVVGDLTVPNEADENPLGKALPAPLAGTEPLMALLDIGAQGAGGKLADGTGYSLVNASNPVSSAAPAASFFFGQNPCGNANHGTFVAPAVPANPNDAICPDGSDTSAAFAEMVGEVLGNILDLGVPVKNSAVLGDSPTAATALDQTP